MGLAYVEDVVDQHQAGDQDDGEGPDQAGSTHVSRDSSHRISPVVVSGTVTQTRPGLQPGCSPQQRAPASI